jgi:glutamine synthetase
MMAMDATGNRAGKETGNEVAAFLENNPDITHLDTVLIDLCGQAYGKRLPRSHIAKLYENGTPVCAAMSLVDVLGNTADPMGHGFSDGDPDAIVRPVPGRLVRAPWVPGLAQVLCAPEHAVTGKPLWYDPRTVLKRVVERFGDLKLTPVTAVELEFYFISPDRDENGVPQPAASPRNGRPEAAGKVLSLDKMDEFGPVISAIEVSCKAQNLPISTMISEYGPGQFEINLEHCDDPVKACDDAVLLRRCITSMARANGLDATFMSVPFAGQSGSGMHIHASLADETGNIFDPARKDSDAELSASIAGLRDIHAEAMAIFAPNLNVYRRYIADNFTPVTTDWGENNRSVAFRLPSGPASARRMEHRAAGAEANPYLVMAAVLAGIHHGLTNRLDAGEKSTGNVGAEVDEQLPLNLWRALDATRDAKILPGYFGTNYCRIYAEVKQAEFAAFMETISKQEYDWYL